MDRSDFIKARSGLEIMLAIWKNAHGSYYDPEDEIDEDIERVRHEVGVLSQSTPHKYDEWCQNCEYEIGADELKGTCPVCGKLLVVCSMCRVTEGASILTCDGCVNGSNMRVSEENGTDTAGNTGK